MYDVSKNRQKWKIRQAALSKYPHLNKKEVLEVFAGWGNMTQYWSQIADTLYVNDIDESKMESIIQPNVIKLSKDYRDVEIIEMSKEIEVVDCDAFGLIMNYVKRLCEVSQVDKLIFFTDGIKKRAKALKRINIERYFHNYNYDDLYYESSDMGEVFYGYIYKKK